MHARPRAASAPRLVEESDGEEYPHRTAWAVVIPQLEHGETNPTGSFYDDLVAMVFAFHAMEGYLNFIGGKITPDLWADERTTFKNTGLTGKLEAICERCGMSMPDKGRRPYQTVSGLKELRTRMAHPKIIEVRSRVEFAADKLPPIFRKSYPANLVSHERALRARDDVKWLADEIHKAAVARFPHAAPELGLDALSGIHSRRTWSTRLAHPDG